MRATNRLLRKTCEVLVRHCSLNVAFQKQFWAIKPQCHRRSGFLEWSNDDLCLRSRVDRLARILDESSIRSQSSGIWTKDTTDAVCSVDEDE